MNEQTNQLETELSAMRPRRVSSRLAGELCAVVSEPAGQSWSDRVLVFAMGVGALAACVILALLAFEPKYAPPASGNTMTVRGAKLPDHAYAFARTSRLWNDVVN